MHVVNTNTEFINFLFIAKPMWVCSLVYPVVIVVLKINGTFIILTMAVRVCHINGGMA